MAAVRKVVLWSSVSLDGYIEGPGQDIGWHRVDEELHRHFNDELRVMGAFLSGRVTWELMADFWPTADEDPEADAVTADFAAIWRDTPKIVYSRTLDHAAWNTTIVREVVPDEVRALTARPGGDLALSGARVAASFLEHDLVDEFRVYVHPVLVGGGTPLFPATSTGMPASLRLVDTHQFGNGVVMMRHARAADRN